MIAALGVIVGLLAIAGSWMTGISRARGQSLGPESLTWPRVNGIITMSQHRQRRVGHSEVEFGHIRFTYCVDGRHYDGERLMLGDFDYNYSAEVHHYTKGQVIPVTYNPNKPREACLIPGVRYGPDGKGAMAILGSGLMVIFGTALGLWLIVSSLAS